MKQIRLSLAALALTAMSSIPAALAAQANDGVSESWYLGASAGRSSTRFSSSDYTRASGTVSESQDRTKTAGKIFLGYDFNKNWAIEAAYTSFGQPRYQYAGTGAAAGAAATMVVKETAWSIVTKASLPLNEQFGLFAKLGATRNKSESSFTVDSGSAAALTAAGFGANNSQSKSRGEGLIGVGAQFYFNKNLAIRLEYENYGRFGSYDSATATGTGRSRVDLWTAGVSYNF